MAGKRDKKPPSMSDKCICNCKGCLAATKPTDPGHCKKHGKNCHVNCWNWGE